MFQFQYELIFTCAYAYQATCACKSCAIDYEHNMIMMKRTCTLFSFCFDLCGATTILITCAYQIKAVCCLRTSLRLCFFCRSILNTQGKILLCANNNTIILPFKLNLYFKFAATGSKFDPMPSRLQRLANRYFFISDFHTETPLAYIGVVNLFAHAQLQHCSFALEISTIP